MFKFNYFLVALLILGCNTTNSESEIPLLEVNYEFSQINGYPDYIEAYSQSEIDAFIATLPESMRRYTEISKFGDFEFNFLDDEWSVDLFPISNEDSIRNAFKSFLYNYSEFTNIEDTSLFSFIDFKDSRNETLWTISTSEQQTDAGAILPYTGYRLSLTSKGLTSIQGVWYGKDIYIPNFQFVPQISVNEAIQKVTGNKIIGTCGREIGLTQEYLTNITSVIVSHDLDSKRVFLIAWKLEFGGGIYSVVYVDKVSAQIIRTGSVEICHH